MLNYLNSLINTPTASPVLFQVQVSSMVFRHVLNESMTDISSCDFSYTGQGCFWLLQWWSTILLRAFNSFMYFSLASENPASFPRPCTSLLIHPMWWLLLSQCCIGERLGLKQGSVFVTSIASVGHRPFAEAVIILTTVATDQSVLCCMGNFSKLMT